jgi:Mrp family chromosome partitioning ATPase
VVIICWSAKGGSGTSVVAALLALTRAERDRDVLLVDLAGDLPAVLAVASAGAPGVAEWLADSDAPAEALTRLELVVAPRLSLLPLGIGPLDGGARGELLASLLRADGRDVVVDAGTLEPDGPSGPAPLQRMFASSAEQSLLVIRPCYVALQRALRVDVRPTGVVLVDEEGRALDERDVHQVLGVDIAAVLPVDPSVARAVDAGLLASRVPRRARRALRCVA